MTKFRDFGSNDSGEKEPVSFKIHGEEFYCHPELQGKVLLDLVSKSNSDDAAEAANSINFFFKHTLIEESYERFNALLLHPDKIVQMEKLGEISAWLVEVYTSRPTQGPEVSSPGE
jgi:hypothetical protein